MAENEFEFYVYRAVVKYVYDGDTATVDIDLGFGVWMKSQVLRFYGVDAPEIRTRDAEEKERGRKVKAFVMDKLLNKEVVIKTYKDKKGKYGRWIAEIFYVNVDGERININDELLEKGLAKPFMRDK